jgi:hypothetical protein
MPWVGTLFYTVKKDPSYIVCAPNFWTGAGLAFWIAVPTLQKEQYFFKVAIANKPFYHCTVCKSEHKKYESITLEFEKSSALKNYGLHNNKM